MAQIITAIYEQGRLRPLQKLSLRENQTVQLRILTPENEAEAALTALVEAGLVKPAPPADLPPEVSPALLRQAADALGAAGSVSALIIQDRG